MEKKLGDVAESQLVAESLENRQKHDISRKLKVVERLSSSFVESTLTPPTVVDLVAQ